MSNVIDIIGESETKELKGELNDLLSTETNYEEVEDLMLSYGLEMDYLEQLLF
jgi:hypothetical protein